jgi:hypothetical protein
MNFILFTNQGYPLQNSSLGQLHSDGPTTPSGHTKWTTFTYTSPHIWRITNIFKHTNEKLSFMYNDTIVQLSKPTNVYRAHWIINTILNWIQCTLGFSAISFTVYHNFMHIITVFNVSCISVCGYFLKYSDLERHALTYFAPHYVG